MSLRIIVILLSLLSLLNISYSNVSSPPSSCVCSHSTYRFVDNLNDFSYVARVKYIEKEITPKDVTRYGSFGRYNLVEKYKGPDIGDSITIIGCAGMDCFGCHPSSIAEGAEYIVKANFEQRDNYEYESDFDAMMSNKKELILTFEICHENHLLINEEGLVYGNITKNKNRRRSKFNRILRSISFGLIKGKEIEGSNLQEMKLKKVERIIRTSLSPYFPFFLN